jgi:hypothetical protein
VIASTTPDPLARHRLILATPARWPLWPFLPVVRRCRGEEELGVLFDALHAAGRAGYSATVWFTNIFTLPTTLAEFLALPREVYDSVDELVAAGWRAD